MPEIEPTQALLTCERALRQLFSHAFEAAYGPRWLETISGADKLENWRERRDEEQRRRLAKGAVAVPESDELAYAEFYDLLNIAERHWQHLAPALGKQKDMLPLLRRFEALRNTVAHSRQPLSFEADLLSGIAGEIRNRVTIYMTETDAHGEHYPRIESVTDSFGRQATWQRPATAPVTVDVGDVVRFECVGSDAQGRALHWAIGTANQITPPDKGDPAGARVTLEWQVGEQDVREANHVSVALASSGSFHRHGSYDAFVSFVFAVRPPT